MCTLYTIYLVCTNRTCSAITDHRPALSLCSRARRAACRRTFIPDTFSRLRAALAGPSSDGASVTTPQSAATPAARSPKPCRTATNVVVTTHFAFLFNYCDACLAAPGVVQPAEQGTCRARRNAAWGVLPQPGRSQSMVNFLDVYERMVAAGAEPRDVTPLFARAEAMMWDEVNAWFVSVQSEADPASQQKLRRKRDARGSGPRLPSEVGSYRNVSDGTSDEKSKHSSTGATELSAAGEVHEIASPEVSLVHDMLWHTAPRS